MALPAFVWKSEACLCGRAARRQVGSRKWEACLYGQAARYRWQKVSFHEPSGNLKQEGDMRRGRRLTLMSKNNSRPRE